jgi:hypothetical protein
MKNHLRILKDHCAANPFAAFLLSDKGKILAKNKMATSLFPYNSSITPPPCPKDETRRITLLETSKGNYFCAVEPVEGKEALYCMTLVPALLTPTPSPFFALLDVIRSHTDALLSGISELSNNPKELRYLEYIQKTALKFSYYQRMLLGYLQVYEDTNLVEPSSFSVSGVLKLIYSELPAEMKTSPYVLNFNFENMGFARFNCRDFCYTVLNMLCCILSASANRSVNGTIEEDNCTITLVFSAPVPDRAFTSYRNCLIAGKSSDADILINYPLYFSNLIAARNNSHIESEYTDDGQFEIRLVLKKTWMPHCI